MMIAINSFTLGRIRVISMNCLEMYLVSQYQWISAENIPRNMRQAIPLLFGNQDLFSEWLVVIIQWTNDWIDPSIISHQLANEWIEIERRYVTMKYASFTNILSY